MNNDSETTGQKKKSLTRKLGVCSVITEDCSRSCVRGCVATSWTTTLPLLSKTLEPRGNKLMSSQITSLLFHSANLGQILIAHWYSLTLELCTVLGASSGVASFRWPLLWPSTAFMAFIRSGESFSWPPSTTPIWARPPLSLSRMSWANSTAWSQNWTK